MALQRRKRIYSVVHRNLTIEFQMPALISRVPRIRKNLLMKKFLSLLMIISIVLASNCSRVPENNDPVIGIWSKAETEETSSSAKVRVKEEWIFNDAYLGRYHKYENNTITVENDFRWSIEDETYTISYPGTNFTNDIVIMKTKGNLTVLEVPINGEVLAIRE